MTERSGRSIPREIYAALVEFYRKHPGEHEAASRVVGCNKATARDYYLRGRRDVPWARAIETVLFEEQETLRLADIAEQQRQQREIIEAKAKEEAVKIEARAEELAGVGLNRKNAIGLASGVAYSIPVIVTVVKELQTRTGADKIHKLSTKELRGIVQTLASFAERAERVMSGVLELDRQLQNEPLSVVEHRVVVEAGEAVAQLSRLTDLLAGHKERKARPLPAVTITPHHLDAGTAQEDGE